MASLLPVSGNSGNACQVARRGGNSRNQIFRRSEYEVGVVGEGFAFQQAARQQVSAFSMRQRRGPAFGNQGEAIAVYSFDYAECQDGGGVLYFAARV